VQLVVAEVEFPYAVVGPEAEGGEAVRGEIELGEGIVVAEAEAGEGVAFEL
jgi:hypothetical protein